MKVVAYSIRSFEKEFLAIANRKKHEITLIANPLSLETVGYAEGKDAIIVFTHDEVSGPVIRRLADLGVRYITTRSADTAHIDRQAASDCGIKVANVPAIHPPQLMASITNEILQQVADQTIKNLDAWQQNKCVGKACMCVKNCRGVAGQATS